tara:strand:+ start:8741 stop:9862 length:1122 start_codon:yes stop_codon:yes gene_type:complete
MTIKKINILLTGFFIIIYTLIIYKYQYLKFPNTYTATEWLINYQGGFIRRGFLGEILFFFSDNNIFDIKYIFFYLITFVYSLIIFLFFNLINKIKIDKLIIILIICPLFLVYPLIETDIIGRKEIFLILSILIYVNLFNNKSVKSQIFYIFITTNLLFFLHEGLVFYFQFFFLIFFIINKENIEYKFFFLICLNFVIYYVILLYFTLFFIDQDIEKAGLIINSYTNLSFKNLGAFYWIDKDLNFAIQKQKEFMNYQVIIKYLLINIFFQFLIFFSIRKTKKIFIYLLICNLLTLPIFYIALDWGRFIYILFNLNLITLITIRFKSYSFYEDLVKNNFIYLFLILIFTLWNPKITLFEEINLIPYKDLIERIIY